MFEFKQFSVAHDKCAMKVGTDGVLLGAWTPTDANSILDIGTGSGLIALMLAQRNPSATIDAIEIDPDAAQQAHENFNRSLWANRLKSINADIKTYHSEMKYDLIVSNPPFFTKSMPASDKKRHHVRHDDQLSLQDLAHSISRLLKSEGKFSIILPVTEGLNFINTMNGLSFFPEKITEFIPREGKNPERLLMLFSSKEKEMKQDKIYHYASGTQWTDEYKQLTKNFYIVI